MSEIRVVFNLLPETSEQVRRETQAVLNEGADDIASVAREITSTLYPPASLPGEPPAERSGDLNTSIQEHHDTGPLEATVTAGGDEVDYAVTLEYGGGTNDIAPRPFMTPAAHVTEKSVQERLDHVLDGVGR